MKLFGVERFTEKKLVRLSHNDLVLDSRFGTSLTSPGFTSSMAVHGEHSSRVEFAHLELHFDRLSRCQLPVDPMQARNRLGRLPSVSTLPHYPRR